MNIGLVTILGPQMTLKRRSHDIEKYLRGILAAGLTVSFLLAMSQIQFAQQAAPQAAPVCRRSTTTGRSRRGQRGAIDPRVQQRTYLFTDTNEQLPYAVFVSSKVSKDKKNPLIVALHGLGGDQNTMMRANALQLAEEGGYIMVGPMGYNSGGWYGAPARYGTAAAAAVAWRHGALAARSASGRQHLRRTSSRTRRSATDRWRNCADGSRQAPRSQRKGRDERSGHDPQGIQCR